jgi:hypothetical protein
LDDEFANFGICGGKLGMNAPNDIAAYARVTTLLDPYVAGILAGQYRESDVGTHYDPALERPNFERSLAQKRDTPISIALQKNLIELSYHITDEATAALKQLLGRTWERSGGFLYPALNGFMDWHTNHTTVGARIYLVWCYEGAKSRFLTSSDRGKSIDAIREPAGWSVNTFMLRDEKNPFWHAVDSGGTDRISFGFKRMSSETLLAQQPGLFMGVPKKQ